MTNHDALRTRFRIANPVPDPNAIDADELDRMLMAIESEWDQVRGLAAPSTAPRKTRRSRLVPALVFGAAVLLVLLAVGLPMLILGGGEEPPPAEEPTTVPTTTATTVPPTTVPTTVAVDPTRTTEADQATSAPAMTWKRLSHEPIFDGAVVWDIVVGGPGLIAGGWVGDFWSDDGVSHASVFVSADGVAWERLDLPPIGKGQGGITNLAVGTDGTVVAFGRDVDRQVLFVSPDGLEWERLSSDAFDYGGRIGVSSVVAGGPGFVAVGNTATGDAAVWVSEDGYEWARVEDEDLIGRKTDELNLGMSDVVTAGPGLVAVGFSGIANQGHEGMAVWVSKDGSDWERLENLDDRSVGGLFSDPETDRITAFGANMWTSLDGYTWTMAEQGDSGNQLPDSSKLAWDGERVVAVVRAQTLPLWVSDDRGATWSRDDKNGPVFDGYRTLINDVVRFKDSFVAVGEVGVYMQEVAVIWIGTWDE